VPQAPRWAAACLACAFALACGARDATSDANTAPALRPPTPEEALVGLPRDRAFPIAIETDLGPVHCELDPVRAPNAVALFVGLATGRASFLDPRTQAVVRRPMYRDLTFFRAVAGVMIQSGDPRDDATGTPGYRIAVERSHDDAQRLATAGALILARYQPPPNRADPSPPAPGQVLGSQFAVLLTAMPHLVGQVSVLGRCDDLERARAIAEDVASKRTPHRLLRVQIGAGPALPR
jgi:cyclophilin family peptidyl-prolyl cis-trans isomerase